MNNQNTERRGRKPWLVSEDTSDEGHGEGPAPCVGGSAAATVTTFSTCVDDGGREPEPMPRTDADDLRVVFHECSHVAVGRQFSPIGGCTCEPGPDYAGLTWGPAYVRRAKFSENHVPDFCSQIAASMPGPGESRAEFADVFLHVFSQVAELVAGTEGERLFLPGEPWYAADDERQAMAYASLITSSPASARAFIAFARVEAISLLTASAHIVRALADELRIKRTMDGAVIDLCIERAVATNAAANERKRRLDWQCIEQSAECFAGLSQELA